MIKTVIKRNGEREDFDVEKLNKWAEWASQECGVAWSDILFDSVRLLKDDVETKDIHHAMIETCLSRKDTGHAAMAARLLLGKIYKEAFHAAKIPTFKKFYKRMVKNAWWDDLGYSDEELDRLGEEINHNLDFEYSYSTLKQFYDKYAIKINGDLKESPQFAWLGIAMSNYRHEKYNRIDQVIELYKDLRDLKDNLPTPSLNGERTPLQGSPSCCVISGGDTVPSMGAATHVAYTMTSQRSGIGVEFETRGPGDPVKNGRIEHKGKFAYYSYLDRAVKANTQVTRGGSATVTYTCLDPEIQTLLLGLKSTRVDEESRIDKMDYSFAMHNLFLKKVAENKDWMLISPYYAPKLYELFYQDKPAAFEKEYDRIMATESIPKKIVKARDIVFDFIKYRNENGRIYAFFVSNVNKHTPFLDPIRQSNLCQEILLATSPYNDVSELFRQDDDITGEVALCFIGSIVPTHIKDDADYEETVYRLCKFIDNTTENAQYPFPHVERTAKARRSIGVGLTDVAHWMAKHGYSYDTDEGRRAIHRLAEKHSYFLHKASVRLARERGACEWMHKTKYGNKKPWLPIDTYNRAVDDIVDEPLHYDWEGLRKEMRESGVRFSVLEAFMPVESSSVLTSSTNGLYPIRKKKVYKSSRKGSVYFQVPELDKLDQRYQIAYDIDTADMVKFYSIFQKFTGQSISADFYHDFNKSPKISQKETLQNILLSAKLGMKTWYYLNFEVSSAAAVRDQEDEAPAQEKTRPAPTLAEPTEVDDDDDCCKL